MYTYVYLSIYSTVIFFSCPVTEISIYFAICITIGFETRIKERRNNKSFRGQNNTLISPKGVAIGWLSLQVHRNIFLQKKLGDSDSEKMRGGAPR